MRNFMDRLAIGDMLDVDTTDRLDTAEEGNMSDFLEMIVQWTRGKNVLKEENCMVLTFG